MFDYTQHQQVFPAGAQLPYDRELIAEMDAARKAFEGTLFIDRVMKALGFIKGKLYPPKSDAALRQLHQQICESAMSLHYKFSLLYYILLDFDQLDARTLASEDFATQSGMPRHYQLFMKGLWHLDKQEFSTALEFISHPSLIPDFSDEILTALVRCAPSDEYALAYFHTVQPVLKTSAALELLFDAMARTSAVEALFYSRTHPDHTRRVLFQRLVTATLDNQNSAAGDLAFLPFDAEESTWFEEYLASGDGKGSQKAKDTLLIRKIANDRYAEVSKQKCNGQWGPVIEGIKAGTEGHRE